MTIYNWAEIPAEVKFIATDGDSLIAFGWKYEPIKNNHLQQFESARSLAKVSLTNFSIEAQKNPFRGDWRESLEARPTHPCSGKCPRFDKEQCGTCLVGEGA